MRFFHILQFCDLQGTFWPLKSVHIIPLPYSELEVLLKGPLDATRVVLNLEKSPNRN